MVIQEPNNISAQALTAFYNERWEIGTALDQLVFDEIFQELAVSRGSFVHEENSRSHARGRFTPSRSEHALVLFRPGAHTAGCRS